ncbi:N-acetylmuramate alpha-1-phosphate uridylyltransferase MurU [Sulfurivirga sp.]|uniref:N-acetylmuramate alpha-1-phosphate uridylyltransferase MurU n=1 Tax=Sulfurivirga sp. TaxID=2614236 RepID=UPI0025D43BB3|nr:nucleotidyltransferase family protein [Sulfurivirga sp.]
MPEVAMILAAGRGKRMRPLTDTTPKPLLPVCGEPLLGRHLRRLRNAGIQRVVVNGAWLKAQIEAYVTGRDWGMEVIFSPEPPGGLETAGGIVRALPWLGERPFIVVNGDVWTDFDFASLPDQVEAAHLVLVSSPPHNPHGDFGLENGKVLPEGPYTFAGISVLSPALFAGLDDRPAPLAPLLRSAMARGAVTGRLHEGIWHDVGTPERLRDLEKRLGCA